MLHFQYSSLIQAPVETVWEFHTRQDILQVLTPPWQPVKVIRREGGLEIGAISEFCIFLGPISVPWVAVHTEYEKYCLFTDEQKEGPMAYWVHRHQFSNENGQTRLTDVITFSISDKAWIDQWVGWWVNSRLKDMFRYRHQVTKQECEKLVGC